MYCMRTFAFPQTGRAPRPAIARPPSPSIVCSACLCHVVSVPHQTRRDTITLAACHGTGLIKGQIIESRPGGSACPLQRSPVPPTPPRAPFPGEPWGLRPPWPALPAACHWCTRQLSRSRGCRLVSSQEQDSSSLFSPSSSPSALSLSLVDCCRRLVVVVLLLHFLPLVTGQSKFAL